MLSGKRILFIVNWDWFFLSHRYPIAEAALERGMHVGLASVATGAHEALTGTEIDYFQLGGRPGSQNPARDLVMVSGMVRAIRAFRPDIIHLVSVKPLLYGSLAARTLTSVPIVCAFSGIGSLFLSRDWRSRVVRRMVLGGYRLGVGRAGPRSIAVFQNEEDRSLLVRHGAVHPERTVLIRGSGVDLSRFTPRPVPEGEPLVLLPARVTAHKGVREFVAAARKLRREWPGVRFVVAGKVGPGNPSAIPSAEIDAWRREGVVELWGHQRDMVRTLGMSSIVVLPSYREGLSKALVEASAMARPVVTTDVPGCRDVIRNEVEGLLVPPRDGEALASAIDRLLRNPDMRVRLGAAGRIRVERHFSSGKVIADHMKLYERALAPA